MDYAVKPRAVGFRELDVTDLRERTLPPALALLMAAGGYGAWANLPGSRFHRHEFLFFSALILAGLMLWHWRWHPVTPGAGLVATCCLAGVASAFWLDGRLTTVMFQLAIVAATTAIVPLAPLLAALAASICHLALHFWLAPQADISTALPGYVITGVVLAIVNNASYQVLTWSWQRHAQARDLAERLRDGQGQLNRTIKALDLAYRLLQRTNHELAVAREEAELARQLKERFTANISHELRTPLNLILGFSEMMYVSPHVYGDVNWTPPLRRDVAQVYTASRHLSELVDDVLDLSRLNADSMPIRKGMQDLGAIVTEAADTVRDLLRGAPVTIDVQIDPTLPRLLLDHTRMRQVVVNLLNNAIRFTDQGVITVTLERTTEEVLLSVRDTGVGIAAHELDAIFDEFYQADSAARRPSGGMGLGLAISRRFVDMHGGRIWAESTVGQGSTFHVSLPLDARRPALSRLRTSRPAPTPRNPYKETVVVMGGQPDVTRLLERHLDGYNVMPAGSEAEALELIADQHPRAVIANLSLAALVDARRRLAGAAMHSGVPVVFTAIPSATWRTEALKVAGSLQKPVQRAEVLAALRGIAKRGEVLIVDDDRGFVQMLTRIIEADGNYRVRWAYSAAEGLEEMRGHRPDALLLDMLMPEMDGATLLTTMRRDPNLAAIPVIVITATDPDEDVGRMQGGLLAVVQDEGWGVGDSLKTLKAVLERLHPSYFSGEEASEPAAASPA
ncbi:MAG: ATP-binding protein [Anaerolineae bacterium]